ncbi:hypothetical protein PSI9734_01528 [Pseudidiomarina piscicola]|uniref:Uncharacterized protein n=1 Tax=Pseudidiomarina piscicola TaxID=2614830 RepID=A0A6S6WUX7_9GAMM|nr:hypothetical protein [Pseudidiomarina piscicola]CAB0151113.1 hypothetical protein PSI9734_01528 [Pseudidiomarina piscicola]VZT40621.1 hypothetical protein PSI9734_01528 [Pseudomonas aeruginosa]
MNTKQIATLGVVLIACVGGISFAHAQVATGETNVKVEGFFTGSYNDNTLPDGITTEMLPLAFELTIEQDLIAPTIVETIDTIDRYEGVEQTVSVKVFDELGNVLYEETRSSLDAEPDFFRVATSLTVPQGPELADREGFSTQIHFADEVGIRRLDLYLGAVSEFYFWDGGPFSQIEEAAFMQPEPLFASYGGFPTFLVGDNLQPIDLYVDQSTAPVFDDNPTNELPDDNPNDYEAVFYGYTTTISALIQDSDGDGVPDEADNCAASQLDETVIFDGWLNSWVTNYVDESGCSIMDHYAACNAEEEEQSSSPWGWFQPVYSGPNYCETQVVYQLQSSGLIDANEGRMLRRALSRSYSTDEPRYQ